MALLTSSATTWNFVVILLSHTLALAVYIACRIIPLLSWKKTCRSLLGRVTAAIEVPLKTACFEGGIAGVWEACTTEEFEVILDDLLDSSLGETTVYIPWVRWWSWRLRWIVSLCSMPRQSDAETDTQAGQCQNCHCDSKHNGGPTRQMPRFCIAAVSFLYVRGRASIDRFGRRIVIECLHSRPWSHLRHTSVLPYRYATRLTSRSTFSPRYSGAKMSGSISGALAAASSTTVSIADDADMMDVCVGRIYLARTTSLLCKTLYAARRKRRQPNLASHEISWEAGLDFVRGCCSLATDNVSSILHEGILLVRLFAGQHTDNECMGEAVFVASYPSSPWEKKAGQHNMTLDFLSSIIYLVKYCFLDYEITKIFHIRMKHESWWFYRCRTIVR